MILTVPILLDNPLPHSPSTAVNNNNPPAKANSVPIAVSSMDNPLYLSITSVNKYKDATSAPIVTAAPTRLEFFVNRPTIARKAAIPAATSPSIFIPSCNSLKLSSE